MLCSGLARIRPTWFIFLFLCPGNKVPELSEFLVASTAKKQYTYTLFVVWPQVGHVVVKFSEVVLTPTLDFVEDADLSVRRSRECSRLLGTKRILEADFTLVRDVSLVRDFSPAVPGVVKTGSFFVVAMAS